MKKKLGPLPLWAWGVVTVVGVGLAIYIRRRQAGAASLPGTATNAVPAQDTGTGTTGIPVSSGGGAAGSSSNPGDLLGAYQAGEQSGLAAFSSAGQFYSSIFGSALSTLQGLYPTMIPQTPSGGGGGYSAPPASSPAPAPAPPAAPAHATATQTVRTLVYANAPGAITPPAHTTITGPAKKQSGLASYGF